MAGGWLAGRSCSRLPRIALAAVLLVQILDKSGSMALGLATWRPLLYAFGVWALALCAAQPLLRGEMGLRALFVLPAVLFMRSRW